LAKIEYSLDNMDECLLHMYETRHLAQELGDRNILRRLNRLKKKIEKSAVNPDMESLRGINSQEQFSNILVTDSNLQGYLNYILNDLMRKFTVHHGFVTLLDESADGGNVPLVLARRDFREEFNQDH